MPNHTPKTFPIKTKNEQTMQFNFQLTYEEARDAFLLVIDRRSRFSRLTMGILLLLLGLVNVILYAFHPYGLQFALLALLFALFSFLVFTYPTLKAAKAARSVIRRGGTYKLKLSSGGYFILPDGERLTLNGDRHSRVLENARLFAIRPDRYHTLCLPKRVIRPADLASVRQILQSYAGAFHNKSFYKKEEFLK